MDILLLIILIIYVVTSIINIRLEKQKDDVIEEILDLNIRLANERIKVINILINAEITKENYFETINKLKKELAIDLLKSN